MGPLMSSYCNLYIFVDVNYVSKWVVVISLPNNKRKSITLFFKKYIFKGFGTSQAIISHGGSHFCNRFFSALLNKNRMKHKVATLYHPKISGQVEVSNREINYIMVKTMNIGRIN